MPIESMDEDLSATVSCMGSLHQREERKTLSLSAQMLAEEGWRDVIVCNVSSRGMMLRCDSPPGRNTFIEVRHRNANVVGRVIWSRATSFGIYTQDTIDLAALYSRPLSGSQNGSDERRVRPRPKDYQSIQIRRLPTEDASRIFARLFEWSAVVLTVAIGAMFVAQVAQDAMEEPFEKVRHALAPPNSSSEHK